MTEKTTEETKSPLERLREPFPEGTVGKLPKPYRKDSTRGNCPECGGYHGLPAAHLDYVGHAAVTDRLLSTDPEWSWEPFATDDRGLPAVDQNGNLWIRLTVCGVTRIGVGDGPNAKERIGDALRNAAMRFGVALSLWSKDELESGYDESKAVAPHANDRGDAEHRESSGASGKATTRREAPATSGATPTTEITDAQVRGIQARLGKLEIPSADRKTYVEALLLLDEGALSSLKDLTKAQASKVIDALNDALDGSPLSSPPSSAAALGDEQYGYSKAPF